MWCPLQTQVACSWEQVFVRRKISAGGTEVAAAGQEDQWAEEGNVRVGPEGSLVLEEGTNPEEGDHRTEVEHWGSHEDQQEDQSENCPEVEEGNRMEGKVEVVEDPEDLVDPGDRATAAVAAAGWTGGRRLEDRPMVLEGRQVHREVLQPKESMSASTLAVADGRCIVVWVLRRKATESVHLVLRSRKMTKVYIRYVSSKRLCVSWAMASDLHQGWRGHWASEEAEACSPWEARQWSGPSHRFHGRQCSRRSGHWVGSRRLGCRDGPRYRMT